LNGHQPCELTFCYIRKTQIIPCKSTKSSKLLTGSALTGASPGEGTGATMSDGEDDQADSEANMYDPSFDGPDSMGFGLPTESERSLMERVCQELKHELKQVLDEVQRFILEKNYVSSQLRSTHDWTCCKFQ
jgi:hypothetical protein